MYIFTVIFLFSFQTIQATFNVPIESTTISENCNKSVNEQTMSLTWPCDKHPNMNNSLTFHFVKNDNNYSLHHLQLDYIDTDDTPRELIHTLMG